MIGLDIAAFVIGTISDIWGIRADHLDIKEAKQKQEKQLRQGIETLPPIEYKIYVTPDRPITDGFIYRPKHKGYTGELPELGKELRDDQPKT